MIAAFRLLDRAPARPVIDTGETDCEELVWLYYIASVKTGHIEESRTNRLPDKHPLISTGYPGKKSMADRFAVESICVKLC